MSISFGNALAMRLRGTPVGLIRRSLRRLEAAGITISTADLEAQVLAGGNVERAIEAMILAKTSGVPAEWMLVSALDLTGTDPVEAVRRATVEQELEFDRYVSTEPELIVGYVRGSPVEGRCRVRYHNPLLGAEEKLAYMQERLAMRLAILINTAESVAELEARRAEHERRLLQLAKEILPSVVAVSVRYIPVVA